MVARLSYPMFPLGTVLLVSDVRGSYRDAGLVTAAFALGTAATTPFLGRTMDRLGLTRVLVPCGLASGASMAAGALCAAADAPLAVLLVLALGTGLVFPPVSPAMRAVWKVALPGEQLQRAGYALDAVAVETIFVGGPLLLSILVVRTPRAVPLLVTGVLLGVGAVVMALAPAARGWRPAASTAGAGPATGGHRRTILRVPGIALLLLVLVGLAVAFGAIDTSIAATAREVLHDQSKLGLLYLALAGGSAVGGLVYGAYAPRRHEQRRLPVSLAVLAVGLVLVALLQRADPPPLAGLYGLLLATGLCISPTLIMAANLVDAFAPADRGNEAQAWLSTSLTAGSAAGTALAGALIDAHGVTASFGCAAAACAGGAATALVAQRRWAALSAEELSHNVTVR